MQNTEISYEDLRFCAIFGLDYYVLSQSFFIRLSVISQMSGIEKQESSINM
jgi:hypothetical protein